MPMYEYKCSECGHQFKEMKKISDRNEPCEKPCKSCGAPDTISMVIGAPGFSDPFRLGLRKPDGEFQNLLSNIKKNTGQA